MSQTVHDLTLGADHTALVLFDVLDAYVHPADPAKAAKLSELDLAGHLARLLAAARANGLTVCFARADHSADGRDVVTRPTDTDMDLRPWPDRTSAFRPSVHHGESGAQVTPELAPQPQDVQIPKHRWSAFFQTHLELALRTRGVDTVVLAGLSTDVGIASTAFAARDLDFGLVVVRDACWFHRGPNHDFFMDRVFPRMARVMSTERACALMRPAGGAA
jgi:ureidoacrylate peracid hydrolase